MRTTPPVPGWYADPWNPAFQRYWDGHSWTGMTHAAPPHTEPSEKDQTHQKSSRPNQSWIKTLGDWFTTGADWFTTGSAAVKFAKALFGLLVSLGIITIGGVIAGGGSLGHGSSSSSGGSPNSGSSGNGLPATLSAALIQSSDLGTTSGFFGWHKTQAPTSSSSAPSCPTYPQTSEGHVSTALTDVGTGIVLYEDVWELTQPGQAISTYVNTAQGCSFPNDSGDTVTFQADDSDGAYGSESVIYTEGITNPALPGEVPTIGAYNALIMRGNLLASVYLSTGTEGSIDQSTLTSILTAVAKKLLSSRSSSLVDVP
jgi:Protein of unknown function (DUF2510)